MPAPPPCDTCGMAPRKLPTFRAYNSRRTSAETARVAEKAVTLARRGELTRQALQSDVAALIQLEADYYFADHGVRPSRREFDAEVKANVNDLFRHTKAVAEQHGVRPTRPNHHGGYHAPGDPLGNYQRKAVLRSSSGKDRVVTFQRAMRQPGGIVMLDPGGKGPAMARTMMFVRESAIKSIEGPIENL